MAWVGRRRGQRAEVRCFIDTIFGHSLERVGVNASQVAREGARARGGS